MSHEKKVIVVTGASSGIGNSVATLMAKRGNLVYGTCREPASHQKSADEFFEMLRMDVRDDYSVTAAIAEVMEREKRIDVLICCAGYGISGSIEETAIDEARSLLETNYFGTIRSLRAVLPVFRAAHAGRILVISSIAGRIGLPFQSFYSSSKFALEAMVEALRLEVREFGIDAALIEPGGYRTGFFGARSIAEISRASGKDSPYYLNHAAVLRRTDSEPKGDPLEVAKLVERLLRVKRLAVRYSVGPLAQRIGAWLKPFMPSRCYEYILGLAYSIDSESHEENQDSG
ncbi:MAG: SDR family oxidoreductase [Spirochaetota bacterium]